MPALTLGRTPGHGVQWYHRLLRQPYRNRQIHPFVDTGTSGITGEQLP